MKVFFICGFAGSGKSTFTATYSTYLKKQGKNVYLVNLDPAVDKVDYIPDLDIRDNINYKGVMKDYKLGPNGAIMTCMNLFTTKINQVCSILNKKKDVYDYILIDTPGQIEIFTWSASGEILSKFFEAVFPKQVEILYILDSKSRQKGNDPGSLYTSNILHACSVYYKMGLPLRILCNGGPLKISEKSLMERENGRYHDELMDDIRSAMEGIFDELPLLEICAKTSIGYDLLL